jgi:ferritin-like metal-binding protein YciE
MSDPNERDAKLVQYLSEAHGKERELETALQADILLTSKPAYQKRLKQHLKETKAHAKLLERRIKKLGGGGTAVQTVVAKATAAAKAPLHAVRGSGEAEKMLKNAKTQYVSEQEEISTYLALETFATKVGDKETAQIARGIRKEEERMARFLEGQIKQLATAVVQEEVPRGQRGGSSKAKKRGSKKASAKPAAKGAKKASAKKGTAKKTGAKSSGGKKGGAKKAGAKKASAKPAAKKAAKKSPKASGKKSR